MKTAGVLFTLVVTTLSAPLAAAVAQRTARVPQVGLLIPVSSASAAPNIEAFRQGLRELGYVEGQSIAIEARFTDGAVEPLPGLAAELVGLDVDLIVTWGTPAARAAKQATGTIPIVMAAAIDPVATGLVASLSRPGGNITGVTSGASQLSGKALDLLKEIVPRVRRIAVLSNPDNPAEPLLLNEVQAAAEALGVQLQSLTARHPKEFDAVFAVITRERAGALVVIHEPLFLAHKHRILDFAARTRLPVMYERREYVEAGGLMSYGVNFRDNFRRAAAFVDRILKGAKPANLSVEQPTKFELVVNLRTARALGLTVPQSVLIRADEVIQ